MPLISWTAWTICFLLIPNISSRTAEGPERGTARTQLLNYDVLLHAYSRHDCLPYTTISIVILHSDYPASTLLGVADDSLRIYRFDGEWVQDPDVNSRLLQFISSSYSFY